MAKKKPFLRHQHDPVTEWNAATREYNADEALKKLDDLLEMLDELPPEKWAIAYDFFASVQHSANNMLRVMLQKKTCSRNQWAAIENWTAGISKWFPTADRDADSR